MSHSNNSQLRNEWGEILARVGQKFSNMVLLDADVGPATKAERFSEEFPDRYVQLGCSEQNIISAAAGMSTMGIIPVTSMFACFLTKRAADQVSISVAFTRANVKLCGSYAGLTTPNTGPTHQSIDDVNIMRAMPGMIVMEAADAIELEQIMEASLLHEGPTYTRIVRCPCQRVVPDNYNFQIGKSLKLREGSDVTLIGSGLTVSMCLKAADKLMEKSISADVINMSTIKPIDAHAIVESAQKTRNVVTVENHSVIGGLGSATAEVLSEHCPTSLRRIGVQDSFGKSGLLDNILQHFGLEPTNILQQVEQLLKSDK